MHKYQRMPDKRENREKLNTMHFHFKSKGKKKSTDIFISPSGLTSLACRYERQERGHLQFHLTSGGRGLHGEVIYQPALGTWVTTRDSRGEVINSPALRHDFLQSLHRQDSKLMCVIMDNCKQDRSSVNRYCFFSKHISFRASVFVPPVQQHQVCLPFRHCVCKREKERGREERESFFFKFDFEKFFFNNLYF